MSVPVNSLSYELVELGYDSCGNYGHVASVESCNVAISLHKFSLLVVSSEWRAFVPAACLFGAAFSP